MLSWYLDTAAKMCFGITELLVCNSSSQTQRCHASALADESWGCHVQGEPEAKAGSPSERTDHWVVASDQESAERLIQQKHPGQAIVSIEQASTSQLRMTSV